MCLLCTGSPLTLKKPLHAANCGAVKNAGISQLPLGRPYRIRPPHCCECMLHVLIVASPLGLFVSASESATRPHISRAWISLQVVGGSLHEMLDTILLFCVAVKKALQPHSALSGDSAQEKYLRRAAAQHCVKCSSLFTSQIHQLIVSLSQCNLKVVSGSEVTWLLESLNCGGFYDTVLQ